MLPEPTHCALRFQDCPTLKRPLDVPKGQVGNGYLPERDEVQISVLLLSIGGFLVVLDCLGWLTADETNPTLGKQEKYT